ncbi:outer membrane lipoprotein chaperone LolA [Roseateles sp. BYS180W]|uniref:Outer-membrane lipoprotein carrier protein n=1 Tax=Roseateles rivi TaxID=3299028 RepID=A0ABW7FUS1_9BURK
MKTTTLKFWRSLAGLALGAMAALSAQADALQDLQGFVSKASSGRAQFTQTVSTPDGKRTKQSHGTFEFQRPNQFRFAYEKPVQQLIVGDGREVWLYDPELQQASVRPFGKALGATPLALLAGTQLQDEFTLKAEANSEGLSWVLATPRRADSGFQSLRLGFSSGQLAALEFVDAFGQRSVLRFSQLQLNVKVAAERFRFSPPTGVDVLRQP